MEIIEYNPYRDLELKEGESLVDKDGETYLFTTNSKGGPTSIRINRYPRKERCNALTRVGYCMRYPVRESKSQKCIYHGGARGKTSNVVNRAFKRGRHANYVPDKVADIYDDLEQLSAAEAKSLYGDIAYLESLSQYYMSQSDTSALDIPLIHEQLVDKLKGLRRAIVTETGLASVILQLNEIDELLQPLVKAASNEKLAINLIERKSKIVSKQVDIESKIAQQGMVYDGAYVLRMIVSLLGLVRDIMQENRVSKRIIDTVFHEVAQYSESEDFAAMLGAMVSKDNEI